MADHLDNDTRGWIMAAVSGVACIFGACVICIDFLIRLLPSKRDFQVQNSDTFLSSSLSLSFGVLLFSSLYNILPESKTSFIHGGFSASKASWALIGCFIGGVVGIQVLSRTFHHFMPSHVVGCEHTHDAGDEEEAMDPHNHHHNHNHGHGHGHNHDNEPHRHHDHGHGHGHSHGHSQSHGHSHDHGHDHHAHRHKQHQARKVHAQKATDIPSSTHRAAEGDNMKRLSESEPLLNRSKRPPPLTTRVSSFLSGARTRCDGKGPCYGYSDPCGKECYKIQARRASTANLRGSSVYGSISQPSSAEPDTGRFLTHVGGHENSCGASGHLNAPGSHNADLDLSSDSTVTSSHSHVGSQHGGDIDDPELSKSHHHHVPSNAFLSIGLQTSFAIALHKLPEGFITYATNHANPELGFSIFVALFIHNITEGFALALPLYLAIHSRWKAIATASVLGGASQPLGAAIAALWFRLDGNRGVATNEVVYGCMFAITSGIMTSVALQLFSESLSLSHSRSLCIIWAFVGMAFLGMSSALTA